jgi:hypothetical protein
MKISQRYSDFNTEVTSSVPYLVLPANVTRLQLPSQTVTDIGTNFTNWGNKWTPYIDPAQHTDISVININNAYHSFHPLIEGVKKMLKSNTAITLTGDDYGSIHIHQDLDHRAHVPRPTVAPANQVIKTSHLVTKIFTNNPQEGFENQTKLPVDVKKVGRKIAVVPPFVTPIPPGGGGAAFPVPLPEQYMTLEPIGSTIYDLVFQPEQEGAMAYIITYYINPRGEAGPPSAPFAFRII